MANNKLKVTSVFMLMLLVVTCVAAIENTEKESGSKSWMEWAKNKLYGGRFGAKANDLDDTAKKANEKITDTTTGAGKYAADKATAAKDKASEVGEGASGKAGEAKDKASELGEEAYGKAGEAKDKVAEEGKKKGSETEDTLGWAKDKVKAGYDAAKAKAGETYEAAKGKSHDAVHQKDDLRQEL